jgi:signal transduction histidine kinase
LRKESLNNIVKHAKARHVVVRLLRRNRGFALRVTDDGCGYDVASIPPGHFRVGIMRERVEAIGGTLSINSRPSLGTSVTLIWSEPRARAGSTT